MDLISRLEKIIEPALKQNELELVQIKISGQIRILLQIMIERQVRTAVTMDDCVRASRQISVILDVEDPIEKSYRLEVTSPGLDRPLIKTTDFQRFVGSEIKIQSYEPYKGRKKFSGFLTKADEHSITLTEEENSEEGLEFKYEEIRSAHLVPIFNS